MEILQSGNWQLTHQGIAFDKNGVLIDGQHRLWAIVEADVKAPLLVTRGVEPETQEAIDDSVRSHLDILRLEGDKIPAAIHIGVSNAMMAGLTGTALRGRNRGRDLSFFRKHREVIFRGVELFPKRVAKITTAPVIAVVARALYTVEEEPLRGFAEGVCLGNQVGSTHLLRDYLMLRNYTGGTAARSEVYGKTERALVAYINNHSITRLHAVTEEQFEIPA